MSLKWLNIKLPDPVASTMRSGRTPQPAMMGRIKPAAVIAETVAEPSASRNRAAGGARGSQPVVPFRLGR